MKSIIKLINIHFWKSILSPFFAFIFPIIFILILGLLLGYDQLLAGALSIPSMAVGLIAMPQAIFEFKKSVLLKRIGVTKIKPWMFLIAISMFYISIMVLSTIFCLLMSMAIFANYWDVGKELLSQYPNFINDSSTTINIYSISLKNMLSNVNWLEFIYGVLMNILVATSLGLLLVSVLKTSLAIQAVGVPILIISQFLSAQVLPIAMVVDVEAMRYMSYISPFRYSAGLMINAWDGSVKWTNEQINGVASSILNLTNIGANNYAVQLEHNSIFNISSPMYYYGISKINPTEIFNKADKIVNLVMPYVWTILFSGIAVKFFKWNNR